MDSDISEWILEFVLRQPLEQHLLASLLQVLPLPNHSFMFKKSLLLRKIESEVSNGVVPETVLTLLEHMEELKYLEASDAIKSAYCAVAVDCTVRFLKEGDVKGEYFEAIKRIWRGRGRVCQMEKFGNVGLISAELLEWKDELEAALWDDSVGEKLVKRSQGINAVERVMHYVKEENQRFGQSFLEFVAESLKGNEDDDAYGVIGMGKGKGKSEENDQFRGKAPPLPSNGKNVDYNSTGVQERNVLPRRTRRRVSGAYKICNVDEVGDGPSTSKYDMLTTPQVNKVQERLESSRLELEADAVILSKASQNTHKAVGEDQNRIDPCVTENAEIAQSKPVEEDQNRSNPCVSRNGEHRGIVGNGCRPNQTNAPKPSLMERNSTAHTFEWDNSPEESHRPHLPIPRRRPVSLLKIHKIEKLTRRRPKKRWSNEEEDTLRKGVHKYGAGNWKSILHAHRSTFDERTEGDLKDKWRNMMRAG